MARTEALEEVAVYKDELPVDPSRREAIKTALKVGAYATPVILAAARPTPVSAQVTGPSGELKGTVTDAETTNPIAGATISVGALSAVSDEAGHYVIANAPAGMQSVQVSATGYVTRVDTVNITAGGSTIHNVTLTPVAV